MEALGIWEKMRLNGEKQVKTEFPHISQEMARLLVLERIIPEFFVAMNTEGFSFKKETEKSMEPKEKKDVKRRKKSSSQTELKLK